MLLLNSSERNEGHVKQKKGRKSMMGAERLSQTLGLANYNNYSRALTGTPEVTISNY